jgi:plastocyanin
MALNHAKLGGLLIVIALAACGDDEPAGPPGPPVMTTNVSVMNNSFSPPHIGVAPNATVTWTWNSAGTGHNVTWASGPQPQPANSATLTSGTHTATLATAGVYLYFCSIHTGMDGWVTVQ